MLLSFFESIKYVGHLVPLAFLRVYLGYYYLENALQKYRGDYLSRPTLADQMTEWLPASNAPDWFKIFANTTLVSHWQTLAFIIVGIEFAIAVSYLIGYVVRPIAVFASLLCILMLFISGPENELFLKTLLAIHFVMAWSGAGRCLGVDYYFFKRRRGIWW